MNKNNKITNLDIRYEEIKKLNKKCLMDSAITFTGINVTYFSSLALHNTFDEYVSSIRKDTTASDYIKVHSETKLIGLSILVSGTLSVIGILCFIENMKEKFKLKREIKKDTVKILKK